MIAGSLFISSSIAHAEELTEQEILPQGDPAMESTYDTYLKDSGYPQDIIDMYDIDQKRELYDLGGIYVGGSDVITDTVGVPTNPDVEIDPLIQPLVLQDNNFTHSISVSRIRSAGKGQAVFKLNYNWDWQYDPVFHGRDKFAVAWDGGYSIRNGSPMRSYKMFGKRLDLLGEATSGGGNVQTQSYIQPGAGVGWNIDLIERSTTDVGEIIAYRHKGWGGVKLDIGHDNSGDVVINNAIGEYWHKRLTVKDPSITFSVTDGPSLGLSVGTNFEGTNTAFTQIKWHQSDYLIQ